MNVLEVFAVAFTADGTETLRHHDLGEADDGVERRADLVADLGEKVGLGGGGLFRLVPCLRELLLNFFPSRDVAKHPAEPIGPVTGRSHGHEHGDQGATGGAADNLASAVAPVRVAV